MKKLLLLLLLIQSYSFAQTDSTLADIASFHKELNEEYRNPQKSPLKGKDLKRFKGHEFFPVDLQYRVTATLSVTPESAFFPMPTSSNVMQDYRTYGTLKFELKGKAYEIPVYQSKRLMVMDQY